MTTKRWLNQLKEFSFFRIIRKVPNNVMKTRIWMQKVGRDKYFGDGGTMSADYITKVFKVDRKSLSIDK